MKVLNSKREIGQAQFVTSAPYGALKEYEDLEQNFNISVAQGGDQSIDNFRENKTPRQNIHPAQWTSASVSQSVNSTSLA